MDNFDSVIRYYTCTKPVISKYHTREDDIRPLAKRRVKWERIIKVHDNKYILDNGTLWWEAADNVVQLDHKKMASEAPIIWERKPDGRELITVRGALNGAGKAGRYRFLRKWLPYGLEFVNRSAVKFIRAQHNSEPPTEHFLPESESEGVRYEDIINNTHPSLTFEREPDNRFPTWKLVSEEFPRYTMRIDREAKRALKEEIDAFYDWAMVIAPMLPLDHIHMRNAKEGLIEYFPNLNKNVFYQWGGDMLRIGLTKEDVISILVDADHPVRAQFLTMMLISMDYKALGTCDDLTAQETRESLRRRFHRWINTNCGFKSKKVKVGE